MTRGKRRTILRRRKTNEPAVLNFAFVNKVQRKFSPLHLKHIDPAWQQKTESATAQLRGAHRPSRCSSRRQPATRRIFASKYTGAWGCWRECGWCVRATRRCGGRRATWGNFLSDVPYEGETVRARLADGALKLHEGGDAFITLPPVNFTKEQISPTRDSRLRWMQSVVHCTHYIAGAGEQAYLCRGGRAGNHLCEPRPN